MFGMGTGGPSSLMTLTTEQLLIALSSAFFLGASSLKEDGLAPLAQLVEQLTLNQWVPGSSP